MDSIDNGLKQSVDSFEAGCRDLGVEPETDVRGHIETLFEEAFELNKNEWEEKGALVLAAARFAGRYAASYAHLRNSSVVRRKHANRGLHQAKDLCTARSLNTKPSLRREWCRDVDIPEDMVAPEPA